MISIDILEKPDLNWNSRLIDCGVGTINQTKERGINFERNGQTPHFLHFLDNKGNIVGQLLYSTASRLEKKGIKSNFLKKIPGLEKTVYFWIYGPIIFKPDLYSEIHSTFGNFLKSKNGKFFGTTSPLLPNDELILKKNYSIKEWRTYLIDLTKTKNELYENIHKHSGRKNIERAIRRGVEVEEINEHSLKDYQIIRNEFKESLGESQMDFKQALAWWKLMKPLGYTGFLARKEGKPIGGLLFSYFNRVIVEAGVARSKEDFSENLYSQDLIKWKIIEWGKENNMKYYDLAGYNPHPINKKEEGIQRYKSKWGGESKSYWIIQE
jgi:hypothetical protein